MSDSIERQRAIDIVKWLMGDSELSRTVQTALHILPSAKPEQRWIPCSERLPENNTKVIVWMAWGGFSMLDYRYKSFYGLNSANNIPSAAVTAWMPLPESYKGEKDE